MTATRVRSRQSDVSGEVVRRGRKRQIPKLQRVQALQWHKVTTVERNDEKNPDGRQHQRTSFKQHPRQSPTGRE